MISVKGIKKIKEICLNKKIKKEVSIFFNEFNK